MRRPDDEAQPKEGEKSGHQTLPQSSKFLGFPDFSLHTVRLNQGPASENPQVSKTLLTTGNYGLQEETRKPLRALALNRGPGPCPTSLHLESPSRNFLGSPRRASCLRTCAAALTQRSPARAQDLRGRVARPRSHRPAAGGVSAPGPRPRASPGVASAEGSHRSRRDGGRAYMKLHPQPLAGPEPDSRAEAGAPGAQRTPRPEVTHGGAALRAGSPAGGEDGGEQRSRRQERRQRRGEGGGVGRAGEARRRRRRTARPGPERRRGEGRPRPAQDPGPGPHSRGPPERGGSSGSSGARAEEGHAPLGCWVSLREGRAAEAGPGRLHRPGGRWVVASPTSPHPQTRYGWAGQLVTNPSASVNGLLVSSVT